MSCSRPFRVAVPEARRFSYRPRFLSSAADGCVVIRRLGSGNGIHVRFRPMCQNSDTLNQGATQMRQCVLDRDRLGLENGALHQPVTLQSFQCLGKHLLRDRSHIDFFKKHTVAS